MNAIIVYAVMMLVYMGFRLTDVTGGGMLRKRLRLRLRERLPRRKELRQRLRRT